MPLVWGKLKSVNRTDKPYLKLRAVRVFERTFDAKFKNVLEIVFHDEEGHRMAGMIRSVNIPKFKDFIIEDEVYAIRNYQVESNIGMNFNTLKDPNNVDESTLFDVIGIVVEIGPVAIKEIKGVPTRMIIFHLMDLEENKLSCTLWNDYVDEFLQHEQQHAGVDGRPWIMIVNFCRAKPFDGRVQLTTSHNITRLISNEVPESEDFRTRWATTNVRNASLTSRSSIVARDELDELASGNLVVASVVSLYGVDKGTTTWICATINSVIDEWYYLACRKCSTKMDESKSHYECSKCQGKRGVFRYKIPFVVSDATADATLIGWDRDCEKLLGISCDALRRAIIDRKKIAYELPDEVEELVGKTFLFKVRIQTNQHFGYNSTFSIVRLVDDDKLVSKYNHWVVEHTDSDFMTLLLREQEEIGEDDADEVTTPMKVAVEKEAVCDTSTAKRNLWEELNNSSEVVLALTAQSASTDKGKSKVNASIDKGKGKVDE
ncbi:replication protein A 70 kDa DNA-binding subunit [Striga asiatica]|uniref:Replication protein A 70 kDa DNA-binding subunit n=1 Tax=Striga asiatica TaxID=4170 RepID=A0A5A7PXL9_STRAF|nr:replication protein A 70 kDa DNA-binding subunit [Striga asiatica]